MSAFNAHDVRATNLNAPANTERVTMAFDAHGLDAVLSMAMHLIAAQPRARQDWLECVAAALDLLLLRINPPRSPRWLATTLVDRSTTPEPSLLATRHIADPHLAHALAHRLTLPAVPGITIGLSSTDDLILASGSDPRQAELLDHQLISIAPRVAPMIVSSFQRCIIAPIAQRAQLLAKLTQAQREVMPWLAAGLTEEQISEKVFRSRHTVHDHIKGIYANLGVSSKFELVRLWYELPAAVLGDASGKATA
jgi:DNA-binding NarL/FixJ family response regulator